MRNSPCFLPFVTLRSCPSACVNALLFALILFILAAPLCAAATTYYVSPSGNDNNAGTQAAPLKTIQAGINNAATGDTVTLAAGTYTGLGDVDLDAHGKSVTVNSMSGAATTIIDCGGSSIYNPPILHRAFYFHSNESNAIISGLTIKNGYYATISNGTYTTYYGAVDIESGSTVTLTGCILNGNTSGAVSNSGTATLTNCAITENSGNSSVSNGGSATLTGCILSARQNFKLANRNRGAARERERGLPRP